jgi:hypothetical protein
MCVLNFRRLFMVNVSYIMICNVCLLKDFPLYYYHGTTVAVLLHVHVLLLIVVFAILTSVLFACRFIVLSTLLCCGGFIYKTRVEHQVFFR